TPIYNPFTGNANGSGRDIFAGGKIPAQYLSPIALKLQSYYPAPNLPGTANNFSAAGGPILDRYYLDTKFNWNRTDKHTIWGKYGRMWATSGGQGIFGVAGGPAPGADPGLGHTVIQIATIGHTYIFSPNLILDGNIGYQRMVQDVKGNDFGTDFSKVLNIPGIDGPDIRQSGFPDIAIGNYTG